MSTQNGGRIKARMINALVAAVAATVSLTSVLAEVPSAARIDPVVDDYYGTQVIDPYRWMETPDSVELRGWMKAQTDYARAELDRIPGRAALLRRITQLDGATSQVYQIIVAGKRFFYFRQAPGEAVPMVYMRNGLAGKEKLLIDPVRLATSKGVHPEIGWFEPSPDGRYLAFGVAMGGGEWGELRVLEVDTGEVLEDRIDRIWAGEGSETYWLPDNRTFTYLRFPELKAGQSPQEKELRVRVHLHKVGRNLLGDGDAALFGFGVDPSIDVPEEGFSFVDVRSGSDFAIAGFETSAVEFGGLWAAPVSSLTAGGPTAWRQIATREDKVSANARMATHGNDLYLVTHRDAPRKMVLRLDLAHGDTAHAAVVVPEGKMVIQDIAAAEDGLYIQDLDGGLSRLRLLAWSPDAAPESVQLPFSGTISNLSTEPSLSGALLRMRSWTRPNEIVRVDPRAGAPWNTGWQEAPAVDFSGIDTLEVSATSYDGTLVPLSILIRKDAKRDGSNPVLLDSYGAYGDGGTSLPFFDATALAWLERGGVLAFAHPRGGGEFGEQWHLGGMKQTKLNTVFDTIACAQYLVDQHYTSPGHLALIGASAGGIAVGGAMNWRPDLFAAVVDHSGATDMLRMEQMANGPANADEFGSIKSEDGFHYLHAASAYANVRDGTAYPAVLLETGYNDPRVAAWMVGKMAARLQAATSSGKPVMLRVDFDSGHFGGTTDQEHELLADRWSFLLWQLGSAGFQPPAP